MCNFAQLEIHKASTLSLRQKLHLYFGVTLTFGNMPDFFQWLLLCITVHHAMIPFKPLLSLLGLFRVCRSSCLEAGVWKQLAAFSEASDHITRLYY